MHATPHPRPAADPHSALDRRSATLARVRRLTRALAQAFVGAGALLLPVNCASCGERDTRLCARCLEALELEQAAWAARPGDLALRVPPAGACVPPPSLAPGVSPPGEVSHARSVYTLYNRCTTDVQGVQPFVNCTLHSGSDTPVAPDTHPGAHEPPPTWAAAEYAGVTRAVILALKERGRSDTARVLAPMLHAALTAGIAAGITESLATPSLAAPNLASAAGVRLALVPVPSTRASVGRRGFAHLELIARKLPNRPRVHRWLQAQPARVDQVGLSIEQRAANAQHSISIRSRRAQAELTALARSGVQVWLVDDIMTTGATLAACVEALETAGIRVCGASVIAHTRRLHDPKNPLEISSSAEYISNTPNKGVQQWNSTFTETTLASRIDSSNT